MCVCVCVCVCVVCVIHCVRTSNLSITGMDASYVRTCALRLLLCNLNSPSVYNKLLLIHMYVYTYVYVYGQM